MKKILIILFDRKVTVHVEFIPQDKKVIQAYNVETLKLLYEVVHRKRPELWPTQRFDPLTSCQKAFGLKNRLLK
jgi:hypothetical protein